MADAKKIIVCGGRDYADSTRVNLVLDRVLFDAGPLYIIHGDAKGADQLAGQWAAKRGVPCAIVPANWDVFDTRAGPVRNSWMLDLKPDLVIAFPGGRGTQSMVEQAKKRGIEVMTVEEGEDG